MNWLRSTTAFCLTLTMFAATSMVAFASPGEKALMGELVVSGSGVHWSGPTVTVNGEEAMTGRTLFSASTIATTDSTTATVRIKNLGSVILAPNSVMNLSFTEKSISGTLTAGKVDVANSAGVDVRIKTPKGSFSNKAMNSGVFTVDANAIPVQDDDDSVSDNDALIPIVVLGGIVAVALIVVLTQGDSNTGAFVSTTS